MRTGNKSDADAGAKVHRAHLHPSPESGFLSRQQVSERYGFSISYLANLPRSVLWYHKVGQKTFYEPKDVDAYIRGQGRGSHAESGPTRRRRGRPRKRPLEAPARGNVAADLQVEV